MAVLARLIVQTDSEQRQVPLYHDTLTLGRGYDNHLVVNESMVSRYHARIDRGAHGYTLTDLQSANGTRLNGALIAPQTAIPLQNGDRIQVGSLEFLFAVNAAAVNPAPVSAGPEPSGLQTPRPSHPSLPEPSLEPKTQISMDLDLPALKLGVPPETLSLRNRPTFTIGRDAKNDLVIPHPTVSRFHARIEQRDGSFVISDLNSSNGTYINGHAVTKPTALRVNDMIRVGPCSLVLNINETLTQNFEEGNLRLDAFHLSKTVGKQVQLLQDVSLSILPREFVVLLGASGSGKSTLLDAMNGLRPASKGNVLVNGLDLYKNFQVFATQMGYVPQQTIIHMELTVAQALSFSAQMRMPPDTTPAERQRRIQEVLDDIGLSHRRDVPIQLLSGGQQRRVSIGVELLNKPSLFFLDEATSGLDPGTEADMMYLLRQLADQGRTVLLITHATQNVRLCDLVIYLAEGGRIAYLGPPDQMLDYFRVYFSQEAAGFALEDFSGIYRFLDPEKNAQAPSPEVLEQTFRESPYYQEYVVSRLQEVAKDSEPSTKARRPQAAVQAQRRVSAWQQFCILSARNIAVLARDRATLALMLAIAPMLGLLDFFTWKSDLFSLEDGSATQSVTMLFVSALIAVMIGEITTMRELVKEDEIYRRERLYGLQLLPYVLSKVWIALLFSLYQGAAYLFVKALAVDLPGGWDVLLTLYFDFTLAILAGAILGLLVSAIAPNQNMAPLLMILVLVPQIIFSGGIQPASNFGPPGQLLNRVNVIKWPFELLVTHSGLGRDVAQDPCSKLTDEARDALTEDELKVCRCYGPNVFKTCAFPGTLTKYVPEIDQPKPEQPAKPTDAALADPQQQQAYQKQLADWRQTYETWERRRQEAIKEAEGVIEKIDDELGYLFDVNVAQHAAIEGGLILGMLILLPIVQKRKDAL